MSETTELLSKNQSVEWNQSLSMENYHTDVQ